MILSKKYYLTYSGSCLRVPMLGKFKTDEWPYNTRKMRPCNRKGKHPHTTKRYNRKRKRR